MELGGEFIEFVYGGWPLKNLKAETEVRKDGDVTVVTRQLSHGLMVVSEVRYYPEFDAYEWKSRFINRSDAPTLIIKDLWDCAVELPLKHDEIHKYTAYMPRESDYALIYAPCGSVWSPVEFYDEPELVTGQKPKGALFPGDKKRVTASGGRSSEEHAPFFNIHKQGQGYIVAVGWSGQWQFECERTQDSVIIKSGIEGTEFFLLPGEEISTSSTLIMPYEGRFIDGQNKWRRLIRKHFSLIGKPGRPDHAPLCAGVWGGMSTEGVLKRLDTLDANELPFEYVWMDAGWYGRGTKPSPDEFEGDWPEHTGDWRVNTFYHPDELKEVSRRVHEGGRRFLLWFEPERVRKNAPIASEHPEYFFKLKDRSDLLLNLGNEEAFNYILETISAKISELQIDCYRQDFNMAPLVYWDAYDYVGRKGISQIKHINGLYRLWDELLRRHEQLIIDCCASGGRRIDIETLKRSIPLWRSDAMCPADFDATTAQCHALAFPNWLPYSGTSTGRIYDTYHARSCYSPALTTNYTFSERDSFGDDAEKIKWLKQTLIEYKAVRPYFDGDFYPLTELSVNSDAWTVIQYHRPEQNDGVILAFRRENSGFPIFEAKLEGLESGKEYVVTDLDSGETQTISEGMVDIVIKNKRESRIMLYREA